MKQTLFVVEGQTEQVFVHKFIENMISVAQVHVSLIKLHGGNIYEMSARGHPLVGSTHVIRILNVEGDDRVNSYINDNLHAIKKKGYDAVYGLRDLYTGSVAKPKVNPAWLDDWANGLEQDFDIVVKIIVAIEEVEAWFLSVPSFFLAYSSTLTIEKITSIIGYDLSTYDVEKIAHPAQVIDNILKDVGKRYRKKLDDTHTITEALDYETLYLEKSTKLTALGRFTSHLTDALP